MVLAIITVAFVIWDCQADAAVGIQGPGNSVRFSSFLVIAQIEETLSKNGDFLYDVCECWTYVNRF